MFDEFKALWGMTPLDETQKIQLFSLLLLLKLY